MQIMNLTPHLQKPPRTARTLGESRLRPAQRVPEDVVEDAQHRRYGTRHGLRGQPRGSAKAVERTRGRYGGACTSMVARRAVAAMAPPSGGAAGARWLPRWTFQSAPSGAAIDGEYPLPGAGCRTVDGDDQRTGVDRAPVGGDEKDLGEGARNVDGDVSRLGGECWTLDADRAAPGGNHQGIGGDCGGIGGEFAPPGAETSIADAGPPTPGGQRLALPTGRDRSGGGRLRRGLV